MVCLSSWEHKHVVVVVGVVATAAAAALGCQTTPFMACALGLLLSSLDPPEMVEKLYFIIFHLFVCRFDCVNNLANES